MGEITTKLRFRDVVRESDVHVTCALSGFTSEQYVKELDVNTSTTTMIARASMKKLTRANHYHNCIGRNVEAQENNEFNAGLEQSTLHSQSTATTVHNITSSSTTSSVI